MCCWSPSWFLFPLICCHSNKLHYPPCEVLSVTISFQFINFDSHILIYTALASWIICPADFLQFDHLRLCQTNQNGIIHIYNKNCDTLERWASIFLWLITTLFLQYSMRDKIRKYKQIQTTFTNFSAQPFAQLWNHDVSLFKLRESSYSNIWDF